MGIFLGRSTLRPEQAKAELKLNREVALNEIVELAPLREAQRELGIGK